ncbi:hypothetical protein J6TS2_42460 [Heyndrickxia sporothermodurans]|nr:hypothetical protein J6TS2_42460 [Heyndrickxia sporothermodurans]
MKKQIEDRDRLIQGLTPEGYIWHHHQDRGILQLIDKEVHNKTGHTGGRAI